LGAEPCPLSQSRDTWDLICDLGINDGFKCGCCREMGRRCFCQGAVDKLFGGAYNLVTCSRGRGVPQDSPLALLSFPGTVSNSDVPAMRKKQPRSQVMHRSCDNVFSAPTYTSVPSVLLRARITPTFARSPRPRPARYSERHTRRRVPANVSRPEGSAPTQTAPLPRRIAPDTLPQHGQRLPAGRTGALRLPRLPPQLMFGAPTLGDDLSDSSQMGGLPAWAKNYANKGPRPKTKNGQQYDVQEN